MTFGQVVALSLRRHATAVLFGKHSPEAEKIRAQVDAHRGRLSNVERLRLAELDAWLENFAEKAGLPPVPPQAA